MHDSKMIEIRERSALVDMLPHQPPFRFVDHVTDYAAGKELKASFYPEPLREVLGDQQHPPASVLIEGLAQTAVIFVQLETDPLQPHEIPLLGKVEASIDGRVDWNAVISYEITPIRLGRSQAALHGEVWANGERAICATLYVAISGREEKGVMA